MDLDLLKEKWVEHDRKLDVSIRLNRQFLMMLSMNRVRSPSRRFAFFTGLGALLGLIGAVILGPFIYRHWAEPRFAVPAIALDVWVIANMAASIRLMAMALQIDFDKPIAVIQKQIESLRMLRIRVTQWALLTGQLVWWIPFLIVALKGFCDVDAYKVFSGVYLIANLAMGLAIIPLAIWVSRKFADRVGRSPVIQWLMRELAGYNLNAAAGFLATLSEFENETRNG
jgi:hypothetical protein